MPLTATQAKDEASIMQGSKAMANYTGMGGGWRIGGLRTIGWTAGALVLLTPLIAMQFTDEVVWTAGDFIFAGTLIAGVGVAYE